MLVSFADVEHQAHCTKCRRDSPMVTGEVGEVEKHLNDLGWKKTSTDAWKCPICCTASTGSYRVIER
jgi:hypothetical protein